MKIGRIENSIGYDLCIHKRDGSKYLINTSLIACPDSEGKPHGSFGMQAKQALDVLAKYGRLYVGDDLSAKTNYTKFSEEEISKIYTVHLRPVLQAGSVIELEKRKRTAAGRIASNLADLLS